MSLNFTPQQMMGGMSYTNRTFVGNWAEDIQYQQERSRHHAQKKSNGQLLSQQIKEKMRVHNADPELTAQHEDGFIHLHDTVMLQCADNQAYVAADLDDYVTIGGHGTKYFLTAALSDRPKLRHAWVIIPVDTPDMPHYPPEEADILHYSQPFKLALHPAILKEGMPQVYLHSEPITGASYSKVTHNQEVTATDRGTYNLIWKCEYLDQALRMEMEGQPIRANVALLLTHCGTSEPLCSQKNASYINDFGKEFELCCVSCRGTGTKKRCLPELPCNHFALITAPPANIDPGRLPKSQPPNITGMLSKEMRLLMERLRDQVTVKADVNGLRRLARILRILSDDGHRQLDRHEFNNGLLTYGLHLTGTELNAIMAAFDRTNSGRISVPEFLSVLRGNLDPGRAQLLKQAYRNIRRLPLVAADPAIDDYAELNDPRGAPTFAEMSKVYDYRKHPDVLSRVKTPDNVLQEFLIGWEVEMDTPVLYSDFMGYYEDISPCLRDDEYFELMIRNVWHLSGGRGISQNTSCRRMLVTHNDGSQTVEEITNDLHIGPTDFEAMKQNLAARGITNVKKLQPYSS